MAYSIPRYYYWIGLLLAGLSHTIASATPATVELQPVTVPTVVVLNGRVEVVNEATLSAQVSARVKAILFDVNDTVPPNTLVVILDDAELNAQMQKAQSALQVAQTDKARAEAEYRRYRALKNKKFVTTETLKQYQSRRDIARASVLAAQAQMTEIRQKLTYTQVKAPYGGIVTARHIEVGETAQVGQPLLSGFDLSALRIQAHIPHTLVAALKQAGYITVQDDQGTWHKITALTIFPQADPTTHTVAVRGLLDQTALQPLPGSTLRLAIPTGEQQVLRVPTSSLVERGDLQAVYVQQGEQIVLRQVVAGERTPDGIQIIAGVQAGEQILIDGPGYQR